MGLISKTITIPVSNCSWYYERLGYDVPLKKSSTCRKRKGHIFDHSKTIEVSVNDLPEKSNYKVTVQCDFCGKIYDTKYSLYTLNISHHNMVACKNCTFKKASMTNQERYGVDCVFSLEETKQKSRETLMKNYNVDSPMKSEEIRARTINTMCKNNTVPTSKQQKYIYELFLKNNIDNVIINQPISKYYTGDIIIGNIDYEIDFGGHDLRVKLKRMTQKEFEQQEIIRERVIKRCGYNVVHIISKRDKLPSDEILLAMMNVSQEYFRTTNHTWIEYDIDNQTVRCALNKEGTFFDYGELHTIR